MIVTVILFFTDVSSLLHHCSYHTSIRMSTDQQIIEHLVLLNVKPNVDSTKASAMIDELNGFVSLGLAIHLSVGELLRSTSSSSSFSHILHCRFRSTDDLQVYNAHPEHLRVVDEHIKPVINDVLVVDWICNSIRDSPKAGSAMRVTLLKLKEDLTEDDKSKFVQVIEGIRNQFKAIEQMSFGENFSHEMSKGYSFAMISVFPGPADLDSDAEIVNLHKEKVKDLIESELVVDYVFPLPVVANR